MSIFKRAAHPSRAEEDRAFSTTMGAKMDGAMVRTKGLLDGRRPMTRETDADGILLVNDSTTP